MLGWSRDKVAKYVALKEICDSAWKVIVTTFENVVTPAEESTVTSDVTGVTLAAPFSADSFSLAYDSETSSGFLVLVSQESVSGCDTGSIPYDE